jgi:hypothetical protein
LPGLPTWPGMPGISRRPSGFFLQAEAFDKAAAGIKKIAMGLSAQGRFADLAGWIDILPDAMVR